MVTDNDGDPDAVAAKYVDYGCDATIVICFDRDETCTTLEPQLLKANGRAKLNAILGTAHVDDDALLRDMGGNNKTETALKFLDSGHFLEIPDYIRNAIE